VTFLFIYLFIIFLGPT